MIQIKETQPGVYEVGTVVVDTRLRQWGKGLTSEENTALKNFIAARRGDVKTIQFGKYKDVTISLIPPQYLYWLKGSKFWLKVDVATQDYINRFLKGETR